MTNTLDEIPRVNTLDWIPRVNTLDQYHGSKYLGPNTSDQKLSFPTSMCLSFCESVCVRIHYLCSVNMRVYTSWSRWTCVYHSFFILCSLIYNYLLLTCYIMIFHLRGKHLYHNANKIPKLKVMCMIKLDYAWLLLWYYFADIVLQLEDTWK